MLLKTGACWLIVAGIFSAGPAQPFNSGTHLYIAERVFPFSFDKIDLYYGSMAPDISLYVPSPSGNWPDGFQDTHYEVINLPHSWWNPVQTSFSRGWKTHNEEWGADYYAHICFFETRTGCTGYVIAKAGELIQSVPLLALVPGDVADALAHFAVEVAVDLLVLENDDRALGQKLFGAALLRSPGDLKLLTRAFVPGKTDAATLASAESVFRDLVMEYGAALSLPAYLRMPALGLLGSQAAGNYGVTISPAEAREILAKAVELCEGDYWAAVQAAVSGISRRIK